MDGLGDGNIFTLNEGTARGMVKMRQNETAAMGRFLVT
jgi:hypothetical protein